MPPTDNPSARRISSLSGPRDQPPGPGDPLFVYGTLMFHDVLLALLDRVPVARPATAPGWRVISLPGRVFPGIVPDSGSTADGLLIEGLTAQEWKIVEAFEDVEYELTELNTTEGDRGWAYTLPASFNRQLNGDWDETDFAQHHRRDYVDACRQWRGRFDGSAAGHGASTDL